MTPDAPSIEAELLGLTILSSGGRFTSQKAMDIVSSHQAAASSSRSSNEKGREAEGEGLVFGYLEVGS